jgi:large subunit ribosomal protein L21e
MLDRKEIRKKGKTGMSRFFFDIKAGDKIALIRDLSFTAPFPKRFQGKTGVVTGIQGKSVTLKVYDGGKEKKFVIQKIHLKKLSS